jgi:hypothetical protein
LAEQWNESPVKRTTVASSSLSSVPLMIPNEKQVERSVVASECPVPVVAIFGKATFLLLHDFSDVGSFPKLHFACRPQLPERCLDLSLTGFCCRTPWKFPVLAAVAKTFGSGEGLQMRHDFIRHFVRRLTGRKMPDPIEQHPPIATGKITLLTL